MKFDLNVLFVLRRAQTDVKGLTPISLRITVNGERAELSANRKVEAKKWNNVAQRALGRSEAARTLNDHLENLETAVRRNFNSLIDSGKEISAPILRDMLSGKLDKDYTLVKVFEKNNRLIKLEEGAKYTSDTIKRYCDTKSYYIIVLQPVTTG